jgi:2-dehydro-3-deoxygalactonokinase
MRAQVESPQGIAATFSTWKNGGHSAEARWGFYYATIRQQVAVLEKKTETALGGVPLVISGMASSTIGMVDLPYKVVPFATDGSDLGVQVHQPGADVDREVVVVSGVRGDDDVMRGEEVQLVGAVASEPESEAERVFIFPGTHSKHVVVRGRWATRIRTYMTGEFFSFLSRHSVLSEMVDADAPWTGDSASFEEGVREGATENLLHACFQVRVKGLLRTANRTQNSQFLSGLLIGSELRDSRESAAEEFVLVATPVFSARYRQALETLGVPGRVSVRGMEEALIKGHARIASGLGWIA